MTDRWVRREYPFTVFHDCREIRLSAKNKADIVADWERFVLWRINVPANELQMLYTTNTLPRAFTRRLYNAFIYYFGYIAHYNQTGFFQERLMHRRDFVEMMMSALRQDVSHYNVWGAHSDQWDLNRAMQAVAQAYLHNIENHIS